MTAALDDAAIIARLVAVAPKPVDPECIWDERPVLVHVRDFARARRASPWAVLGVELARVVTATPPSVQLPPLIGGHASLNLFVGVVGKSGEGKGAAEHAAADALDVGSLTTAPLGSGEGVAHAYMRRVGKERDLEQHEKAVLFRATEVDAVAAISDRSGSTLLAQLRAAWSGEELGFFYVDPAKRLPVPRHQYRLCLVTGIQPARAGVILDDRDGGTPQRFVWLPASDPDAAAGLVEPLPRTWQRPAPLYADSHGRVVLGLCDTAANTIVDAHLARARGDGDALDGHALLCREKVAAALALLDARLTITDDDWRLAGLVMIKSDRTRAAVVETLHAKTAESNRARGQAEGARQIVVTEVIEEAATRRVANRIVSTLTNAGRPLPHSELRRRITSRDRVHFDAAVERCIAAGQVLADDEGVAVQYRVKVA